MKVRDYGDLAGKLTLSLRFDDRVPFIGHEGETAAMPTEDTMEAGELDERYSAERQHFLLDLNYLSISDNPDAIQ